MRAEIVLFLLLTQQKETEQRVRSHYGGRGNGQQMPVLPVKLANSRQTGFCGGG